MARLALALLFLFLTITPGTNEQTEKPIPTSLVQLLATPEKFDGKLVRIVGFLVLDSEGDGLYLHKEDFANGIDSNAVLIERTQKMLEDRENLEFSYVLLVGVFQISENPRNSTASRTGRITKISRCELWSKPSHPRSQVNSDLLKQLHEHP
jgi:hypothetical protein